MKTKHEKQAYLEQQHLEYITDLLSLINYLLTF